MIIVPGILAKTYDELHRQIDTVRGLVDWIQIDIADGEFVGNTTINLKDISDNELTGISAEAHLMVKTPENYLDDCERLKINRVIIHYEAVADLEGLIKKIIAGGMQVAVAFNPETDIQGLEKYIDKLNAVLLMSILPGKQGQDFIPNILEKIPKIRTLDPDIIIGIDGGVKYFNIETIAEYKPDYVVVGSGIWESNDPQAALESLKEKVHIK